MLRRQLPLYVLAALALLPAAAASAQSHAFPQRTYYFKCANPLKPQNANALSTSFAPTWSILAPTGTLQSGAGCGFADTLLKGSGGFTVYDAHYGGIHDEPVRRVEVELHNLVLSRARTGTSMRVGARLWRCVAVGCGPTPAPVLLQEKISTVTPTAGLTQATETVRLSFDNLNLPGYTQNRMLAITIDTLDGASAWVHDASDAPAKVTFFPPPQF